MPALLKLLGLVLLALTIGPSAAAEVASCPDDNSLAVQVLGSGGPIADDGRASTAYVVWVDGASRVLVDAGGGAFLRFGEADARFDDLDFIGLSHFHTDHSADLPALLKSGFFSKRKRPLPIAGPGGAGPFPGLPGFLSAMLDPKHGAYAYLAGYLDGSGGLVKLQQIEVPVESAGPVALTAASSERFEADALPVPHGPVPAIAFRLRLGDATLVFASDQNGSNPAFVDFARDADLLVMHLPIPQDADNVAKNLHATPEKIGAIAQAAGARKLLLSHFMARSLANLDDNVAIVRSRYSGPVIVAEDLACVKIQGGRSAGDRGGVRVSTLALDSDPIADPIAEPPAEAHNQSPRGVSAPAAFPFFQSPESTAVGPGLFAVLQPGGFHDVDAESRFGSYRGVAAVGGGHDLPGAKRHRRHGGAAVGDRPGARFGSAERSGLGGL